MKLSKRLAGLSAAVALVAALASPAISQLSGSYTVDPSGSGSRNFTSMAGAVGALGAGVSGPVTFAVKPVTYTGLLVLTPVGGASSVNTVTFQVAGTTPAIIDANGSSVGILAFEAKWFRLKNFKVQNFTSYGLYLFGIRSPGSTDNEFDNCDFDAPASTSSTVRAIYIQTSYRNKFTNCRIAGGGRPLYHSSSNNCVFDGCEFDGKGSATYCAYFINSNDSDNLVQNCFFHSCSASGYGIYVNASGYGNMYWHNTVIVTTSNSCVWAGCCCAWSRACSYRNNIFVNLGTGTAMKYGASATTLDYNDLDYNCYHAPNTTRGTVELERAIGSFTAGTLAQWQTFLAANQSIIPPGGGTTWDQNSIESDPSLVSMMSPYDIHLKSTSPLIDRGTTKYIAGGWISFPANSTVATDFEGDARGTLVDIGADEIAVRISASGSPSPGGTINFSLSAKTDAGLRYQCGSSLGLGPTPIGSRTLPLSIDPVLELSLKGLAPQIFQNYAGTLDGNGLGSAALAIPNNAALKGVRIHTAFVTLFASAPFGIQSISNAASFSIN